MLLRLNGPNGHTSSPQRRGPQSTGEMRVEAEGKKPMNKGLKILGVIAILILGPKLVTKIMAPDQPPLERVSDATLQGVVASMNAELPKDLGGGTTIEKVSFADKAFRFHYTHAPSSPFRIEDKAAYESRMVTTACTSMKIYFQQGLNVEYETTYTDQGVVKQFVTTIQRAQCSA